MRLFETFENFWTPLILTLIFFLVLTGVDPKSVLCAFFKQGLCKKGDKCKFSHDPEVERRSAKRSVYTDGRGEDDEEDNMDDWDDDKLADVVNKKHGSEKSNQTDIVRIIFPSNFVLTNFSQDFFSPSN